MLLSSLVFGCSADTNKVVDLGLQLCMPGWRDQAAKEGQQPTKAERRVEAALQGLPLAALDMAVAHVVCSIVERTSVHGHYLLTCQIEAAWVRQDYWNGCCFLPCTPQTPPYLSFFGSGTFGAVIPLPHYDQRNAATALHDRALDSTPQDPRQ